MKPFVTAFAIAPFLLVVAQFAYAQAQPPAAPMRVPAAVAAPVAEEQQQDGQDGRRVSVGLTQGCISLLDDLIDRLR